MNGVDWLSVVADNYAEMIIRRIQASDAAGYQEVRKAALKDVPQFVGPLGEQEANCALNELETRIKNEEAEGIYRFGVFLDGRCVGVAAMSRKLNPKYAHKVFFWGLYILPEFRGRSVGRKLMEERIAFARTLSGVRFATLHVTTTNEPARILHQKFGFVSCGVEPEAMCLDGKFYDFELMQLDLSA